MKVILQKDVIGLGDLGEIKEVKGGYARNYLLPRGLAVSAHAGTISALNHQKRNLEIKARKRKAAMEDVAKQMEGLKELEIHARVGSENKLFGSITTMGICEVLAKKGFEIDRRKLELRESIRSVGKYPIRVNLMEGLSLNLELKVVPDALSLKKMKEYEEREGRASKKIAKKKTELEPSEHPKETEETKPLQAVEKKDSVQDDTKEDTQMKASKSKSDTNQTGTQ